MAVTDLAIHTDSITPPVHHIPGELLLDYASGTLGEAWSLVVASHLAFCPHCRQELRGIEAAAGAMLEEIGGVALTSGSGRFTAVAERLGPQDPPPAKLDTAAAETGGLPQPLRSYVAGGLGDVRWRWSGAGLQSLALPVTAGKDGMVSLLKVAPGAGLPMHTHAGDEMTLVLSGGYTVGEVAFQRGDVEIADGSVQHRPLAMAGQPCICLAVTDAPLRFSGALGWFFNQWAKLSV